MSDHLEQALRRAVGIELTDANGSPEEPLPGEPVALNDEDSLRAIIMRGLKEEAQQAATQKQTSEAMTAVLNTLNKK